MVCSGWYYFPFGLSGSTESGRQSSFLTSRLRLSATVIGPYSSSWLTGIDVPALAAFPVALRFHAQIERCPVKHVTAVLPCRGSIRRPKCIRGRTWTLGFLVALVLVRRVCSSWSIPIRSGTPCQQQGEEEEKPLHCRTSCAHSVEADVAKASRASPAHARVIILAISSSPRWTSGIARGAHLFPVGPRGSTETPGSDHPRGIIALRQVHRETAPGRRGPTLPGVTVW